MYQVGDLVLYGTIGVCRVMEIAQQDLSGKGESQAYYHLKPLYQECMISAPVDSPKIFMRQIISRDEAEQLIDRIPEFASREYATGAARELTQQYEAAIQTHKCEDLIGLVTSIYRKKSDLEQQKRRCSAVDEKFMKRAEDLLHGELAAALGPEKSEISAYILARIDGKSQ